MCQHRVPFPSIMENGWESVKLFFINFYSSCTHKRTPECYLRLVTFSRVRFIIYGNWSGFKITRRFNFSVLCQLKRRQNVDMIKSVSIEFSKVLRILLNCKQISHISARRYLPQQRRCSLHSTPNNRKPPTCDGFNNLVSSKHSQQVSQHFDEFNHHASQTPFRRNASTSTLDLVGENNGDVMSGKSNHRAINITKDKSSVSNKLDFNNICGMMRSSSNKSKETNVSENVRRLKPAKNIYYIEERQDEEPNIFIIDPATINKHKKFHQLQKSLEDVRMHKMNNSQAGSTYNSDCDANVGWNFMDRNYYGSRTLPRDFSRRNVRPSLDNLLDNFHQHSSEPERWVEWD